jgi:hypothetical protein
MPDHDGARVPRGDGVGVSGVLGARMSRMALPLRVGRALSLHREGQPFPGDALALYAVARAIPVRKASTD